MMGILWVVLLVALTGAPFIQCLPLRSTPEAYPHDTSGESALEAWRGGGAYALVPALALVLAAVGLLFGCTWCYRHKDCKLFTASATHLHDGRRPQPPDSGFSEPANNNISEDNNNGPISLREMQNIANNNATAYIVSENEERNRVSRESVVEFEPLPNPIRAADPLERCADWFRGEDFPRNRLQYLREIGRGWFGRVVEGEIENNGASTVAVKILSRNAGLEDQARFLEECRLYRDVTHEHVLAFVAKCLQEEPWVLMFELCSMDLQQYLINNRPKMAILNESGTPLQLMCDVASALVYLHSRGHLYRHVSSSNVLVREATGPHPRAVVGSYAATPPLHDFAAPESRRHPPEYTTSSEIWSLGTLIWEVCTWAALTPDRQPPPPDLPCPYRNHLYQVMQMCWNPEASERPTAAQVLALLEHLHSTHMQSRAATHTGTHTGTQHAEDFEARWQTLKPNSIPKLDEHIALVHAPSTSMASHFTGSEEYDDGTTTRDALSVDMDTGVSRSSSIMSDKDPLSVQFRSESLNNLHGSLEDVRNIYLTHNETPALECHQGNISLEERERELDRSDSSVDPWVKDLIAGSQDDVSYYKDVSDVIKNLDNILNSEKTSSSESSHQASPSRDNLSLDCKKEYLIQSSMVKSPGITNFKNILEMSFDADKDDACDDDEVDRDTIGTLSHSFERHSDTTSQLTLENLTPDTPNKDLEFVTKIDADVDKVEDETAASQDTELPNENIDSSDSELPKNERVVSLSSVSENEQLNIKDCLTSCDNLAEIVRTEVEPKSVDNTENDQEKLEKISTPSKANETQTYIEDKINSMQTRENTQNTILPAQITEIATNIVENEVILPAIKIVSKIIHKNELESQASQPNEGIPPRLDVRENKKSEETAIISYDCSKLATIALIEEEKKVCEPIIKTIAMDQVVEESSNQSTISNTENRTEELFTPSEKIKEAILPVKLPEPVQTNSSEFEHFNAETTKAEEPTLTNYVEEGELLGFSSDFAEINVNAHATMNETVKSLLPELVQNVNHIVTEKAETSSPLSNNSQNESFLPENYTEAVITAMITQDNNILPVEITSQPTEILQSDVKEETFENEIREDKSEELEDVPNGDILRPLKLATNQSNDSTAYMDLINYTNSETNTSEVPKDNVKEFIQSCLEKSGIQNDNACSIIKNESTVYLDLPGMSKDTNEFLNSERVSSQEDNVCASTPKGSECSDNNIKKGSENNSLSETKVAEETAIAKSEQKFIADLLSPFDSPTKSHPTDTYDENSSVVLGPFENCAIEYKGVKTEIELPKEELLAFSSNFSEINLETPSPLRDGNFLNEVPDIPCDDQQFDDGTLSEEKKDKSENTDETDQSATTKHVSPSTPPNSPGIYLALTSQQKYLVDIDLETPVMSYPPVETDSGLSSLQKEIDLNQIELQITTKLAMAENENNMNIEYSGPLTLEGIVCEDDAVLRESDAIPEAFLAGNGGSIEDRSEGISLDEECVKLLRNELELKLPLAQVAGIEPEWGELPPPPELVLQYGTGALSPIAEETKHQLTAYDNDAWNPSIRTESSESYPEPCNDSTAEVTDLPTGAGGSADHTYTIHSKEGSHRDNDTYTLQKDIPTSRELTMSADSLNGSPFKKAAAKPQSPVSPIDEKTYNKNDDEKISNCERISQVSPFLMSPTTDTSAPDSVDNATGVSTLSKTTLPTDAKHSKPSECLSKATSIDSWCSNDTLYNVEENFDDLVMEGEIPVDKELVKSASTDTLTHQDDDKETSHCSTYIVHDSKSEQCETFSPDSITANDNYTYTKVKNEATGTTLSVVTKSDENDTTKSQTKDLAYGTLPSYSNCTTELISNMNDPWKFAQPEMVRRSPIDDGITFTPPKVVQDKEITLNDSPQTIEASIKKMDSVELSCLEDDIHSHKSENSESQLVDIESPQNLNNYKNNMMPSITSTPIAEQVLDEDNVEPISINLPTYSDKENSEGAESLMDSLPNFQIFVQSAEIRPQDTTYNQDTAVLLEGDSKTLSRTSCRDSGHVDVADRSPNYSEFENSAARKPQETTVEKSSQNIESGMSSGDFRQFENSVKTCPQDLSSLIDANSLFLNSERKSSDMTANSNTEPSNDQTSQAAIPEYIRNIDISPPNPANLVESQYVIPNINFSMYVTDLDEEETDQPHSIIFTEVTPAQRGVVKTTEETESKNESNEIKESPNETCDLHTEWNHTYDLNPSQSVQPHSIIFTEVTPAQRGVVRTTEETESKNESNEIKESSNKTFDSHTELNHTYDSHFNKSADNNEPKLNGTKELEDDNDGDDDISSKQETSESPKTKILTDITATNAIKDTPNGSLTEVSTDMKDVICNGNSQNYATVNFIHESFEELPENHAAGTKSPKAEPPNKEELKEFASEVETTRSIKQEEPHAEKGEKTEEIVNEVEEKIAVTEDFLNNEKNFCAVNAKPEMLLLNDIRFTGPASEIMSTSFSQESPTEPNSPECERDGTTDVVADIVKEWDSDSESHSSNSSSGEFIWKDGDGHETPLVSNTHFEHQQDGGAGSPRGGGEGGRGRDGDGAGSEASGDSGSGSEGDEVEFVPSSWDCRAAPAKSSMRSLEPQPAQDKKRVVFKRQKYHCVYEYPRELQEVDTHSPAYLPDLSTYCEWDPTSAEEAELGYGQLYGAPLDMYQLRSGIAFGSDYDDDFFISSSARPFESLGLMSSSSQFFPGMHLKPAQTRDHPDFPTPTLTTLSHTRTPSLDFTTPDSGVEDITPGSTSTDEDFKVKPADLTTWRPTDSASSSESVSPSSPGGEALGGLRHTRDKLKLDLPPSPHLPSPRHNRVFNFVLDKPKRTRTEDSTPLVMTDETPVVTSTLPIQKDEDVTVPEPTFSTFGKCKSNSNDESENSEQKIVLTDDSEESPTTESKEEVTTETVKGEGTVLDSGDEDSGIESSSKATLERKTNVS